MELCAIERADATHEKMMRQGSLKLLRAIQVARGEHVPAPRVNLPAKPPKPKHVSKGKEDRLKARLKIAQRRLAQLEAMVQKRSAKDFNLDAAGRLVFVRDIMAATAFVFEVSIDDLTSHSRRAAHVQARQAICLLGRQMTTRSYPEIGRMLGGRDHSTIIHGQRVAIARMEHDHEYKVRVQAVRSMVLGK